MPIIIAGLAELNAKLAAIGREVQSNEARAIFLDAARIVRNEARSQAPVHSGKLKSSIQAFPAKKRGEPAAYAWVSVKKGLRAFAPHGYIVHFGTGIRRPKKRKFMKIQFGDSVKFKKEVRPMPANPFFERAIAAVGQRAIDQAAEKVKARIIAKASKT